MSEVLGQFTALLTIRKENQAMQKSMVKRGVPRGK